MTGGGDILLLGRKLEHNENLGLGHLLAAARRAGLSARMMPLNGWGDLEGIVAEVVARPPRIVGLAFPDGGSAILPLTAGMMIRDAGYRGHITAGGPFATLARDWLLERYDWLDSVVRYAGEVPLVTLAERLAQQLAEPLDAGAAQLDEVPGLTTRAGDGAPAPVLDATPLDLRPERGDLPGLLDHRMAQMTATRGCEGRCAYCGPASLQTDEHREGRRAGHRAMPLIRAGVGGVRRRRLEAICDEMAELWHERDVRYFYFVDEHLLPRRREDALAMIAEWKRGLAARGVGPFGLGCMLRGDRLDPEVIDAFADLGLIRCFVGVELASDEELRSFGRGGDLGHALASMQRLQDRGVVTTCNMMLLHPHSTPETLARGIDFLEGLGAASFETTQMEIYFGTKLHQRLQAEGRVSGNPLRYGYRYDDETVARFAEVFAKLRMEALGDYSMAFAIHDAGLAVALAERLGELSSGAPLRARLARASARANAIRIRAYRQALGQAVVGDEPRVMERIVSDARRALAEVGREVARINHAVLSRADTEARIFAPMQAAAAGVVTFLMSSSSLMGCHDADGVAPPKSAPSGSGAPVVQVDGSAPTSGASANAATSAVASASSNASASASAEGAPVCDAATRARLEARIEALARATDACGGRTITFGRSDPPGFVVSAFRPSASSQVVNDAVADRIASELTASERSCLDAERTSVVVAGEDAEQRRKVIGAIEECRRKANASWTARIAVDLDGSGKVKDVRAANPVIRQCVRRTLAGLSFPCLSQRTVAPQPVIME
jgi:radical SAM superfamily enzyme YgiQ (UPF0313 family)